MNTRSSLLNCPFGASITLLSFSTNLQQFFYKVTHPWTPYLYLEIEMLLIDRFSVFGYLEKVTYFENKDKIFSYTYALLGV